MGVVAALCRLRNKLIHFGTGKKSYIDLQMIANYRLYANASNDLKSSLKEPE